MEVKNCQQNIAEQSGAGFQLRNDNTLQLDCLKGKTGGMAKTLAEKCKEWVACLPHDQKFDLTNLLMAAANPSSKNHQDPTTCLDPSISDPEEWDCECMASLNAHCTTGGRR